MTLRVNQFTRGRRLCRWLGFAGGYPKFHALPRVFKWGATISLFWLDTELCLFLDGRG
jgi:hypothetical protein